MSEFLSSIAAYKREDVVRRRARRTLADLEASLHDVSAPRGFARALAAPRTGASLALIAEIKKASPSKGLIRADFEPGRLARAYEVGGASCLSILTDGPSFMGDDLHLTLARDATALPCLRKEFLVDPWQVAESRALGADAILVILAMVDDSLAADLIAEATRLGMDALIETHDADELARAARLGGTLIGINNRDLRTFRTDLSVTETLARHAPSNSCIITESGISDAADAARMARAGAHAMLVGESLMRQGDVAAATRRLLGLELQPT